MADYTWYDRVTTERVYELPLPSNWAEVGKMVSAATNALEEREPGSSKWDDVVRVTSDGDSLFFTFSLTEEKKRSKIDSIDDQEKSIIVDLDGDVIGWLHPETGIFYSLKREYRTSKGHIWRWAGGFEADEEIFGGLMIPLMHLTAGVPEEERGKEVRLTHLLRDHGPLTLAPTRF